MKNQKHILICLITICIFIVPLLVEAKKTLFVKEISEKIIDYGYLSSFDLDNFNKPHILYVRKPGNFIEYSYLSENKWSRFFKPVVLNGSLPKIKVKGNKPRAIYLKYNYNGYPCALQYMRLSKDKKMWFKDTLNYFPFDEECPKSIDFALDSKNRPHAAYINRKNNTLFYVKKAGKFWKLEKIAKASKDSPLVFKIDSKDNLHFVYLTNSKIKYAFYNSEDKKIKTKTVYQDSKGFTDLPKIAMTTDFHSQPHIAYIVKQNNINYLEYISLRDHKVIDRFQIDSTPSLFSNEKISYFPLDIATWNNYFYILYNLDPISSSTSYVPYAKSKIIKISPYPSFKVLKKKFINVLDFGVYEVNFDKNGYLHIVASGQEDDNKSLVVYKKVKF